VPSPLLGRQQLVANWDPTTDHIEMVGMTAGPAGVASLDFDHLSVDIDVANPTSVAFVSIPDASTAARDTRVRDLVTMLIGEESAEAVLAMAEQTEADRVVVGGGRTTQPGPREQVQPEVASLALALAQAGTPGLLPAERAVAVFEALSLAGRVDVLGHMTWLAREADTALDELERSYSSELDAAGSELMAKIVGICTEATRYVASATDASRLRALADRLASAATPKRGARRESHRDGAETAEVSPDSLTAVAGAPELELHHPEADEFDAVIPDWAARADGWWVRAFSVDGETPIAMAPLLPDGDDAVARLLIPPAHQHRLQLDVVDEPLQPRLSPEAIAFRAAIINGQRAARYQRLGRAGDAVEAWRQSEQWHRVAGSDMRARQAAALVAQHDDSGRSPTSSNQSSVITDHLDAARRDRPT
jgi:hypothetical protein